MKLARFIHKNGTNVYVNPDKVSYIQQHRNDTVLINMDDAGSEFRDLIEVRGNVDYVASVLQEPEDK